ncbi:MAG: T9SS C-terminal target domain-containing protein [Chitinophagia bacterium]|nr:T9SS C-terminal target domain-containing protein [Chitinophagia bacterium]
MRTISLLLLFIYSFHCFSQTVSTIAGTGGSSYTGDGGPASAATLGSMGGIITDLNNNIYVGSDNQTLRQISQCGIIYLVAGTPGRAGFSGDGGSATASTLHFNSFTATDNSGNIFLADNGNQRIRRIAATTGIISTIAGTGTTGFSGDSGMASAATFNTPAFICIDKYNNIYISDLLNYRIRRIDSTGIITTYAGTGTRGHSGDGGPATAAKLFAVGGMKTDTNCNLYFADNYQVRKIDYSTGIITTIAGNGSAGYSGDGGPATSAATNFPQDVAVDQHGNVYFSDVINERVRVIDSSGTIHTILGTGISGFSGDGGPATAAQVYSPRGVAFDLCGNLLIADNGNSRIRKVELQTPLPAPIMSVVVTTPNDTICSGTVLTFTAVDSGNGSCSFYQWFVDTTAIPGATSSTYTYTPANGDSVKCKVATWNRCSSVSYATSNTIHMVVHPIVTPTVTITAAPGDTVCAGTTVTYSSTVSGTTGGSYQWLVNGAAMGSGSATYSYTHTSGDSVQCIFTGSAACLATAHDTSNTIRMVVDSAVHPAITLTGPLVWPPGGTVTITATVTGIAGSYTIYWYLNGALFAATTTPMFSFTKSASYDTVMAILVPNQPCADSAISNTRVISPKNEGWGSNESNILYNIQLYPNPAGNILYVTDLPPQGCTITLCDMLGREWVHTAAMGTTTQIALTGLPTSLYMVRIRDTRTGQNRVLRLRVE